MVDKLQTFAYTVYLIWHFRRHIMANSLNNIIRLNTNNFDSYMNQYAGMMTKKQRDAIRNGFDLTLRLEKYTETALGLRPDVLATKRHTAIWGPPGGGKTFTANEVIKRNNVPVLKIHGASSLHDAMVQIAVFKYKNLGKPFTVWFDDCDSFFDRGSSNALDPLNIVKGMLDPEREIQADGQGGVLAYNVDVTNTINKAMNAAEYDPTKQIIADALTHFRNPNGLGVEIKTNDINFFWTTNRVLPNKKVAFTPKSNGQLDQLKIDQHAVRDRCNWRKFDITEEEAWGWMASVMLSNDVFAAEPLMQGQTLDIQQLMILLQTFYNHWDNLEANSMRTVKEAGAMLLMDPDNFQDEFEQNFVG